ncbi:uncharacterized protein LOC130737899 [Lotus japonicus]|uniref:uncharacterized protein LOC130737899 n=1 Tax=Lotus japonicus TaxID=34305 RepID=UPI002585C7C0|nr:uncharacterized protein LOC130737899 [Lotus japonicus]
MVQGWKGYFDRLSGPIYEKLVKEFWKHAECDDYHVVSHVLGRRIVISEKSITLLMGMEFAKGKRFQNVDNRMSRMRTTVNKELFVNWERKKTEYKSSDLHPNLRLWHKIILSYINPRTLISASDYINATQKVMIYFIKKRTQLCLPFFVFTYLKECLRKSRTTASEKKAMISYIPFGKILSDIFVESGLVQDLIDAGCTEDLTATSGDAFNVKNLKKMKIVKTVVVPPSDESVENIIQRSIPVDDYPLWTKQDDKVVILHCLNMMIEEGYEVDVEEFFRTLPEGIPDEDVPSRKQKRDDSDSESDKKPKKKTKKTKADTMAVGAQSTQNRAPRITGASAKESSKPIVVTSASAFVVINVDAVPSSSPTQTLPPFTSPLIPLYTPLTSSSISTTATIVTTTMAPPSPPSSPKNTPETERDFLKVLRKRTSGPSSTIFLPYKQASTQPTLFNSTPLNVVFPPLTSTETSNVSLSGYSPVNSDRDLIHKLKKDYSKVYTRRGKVGTAIDSTTTHGGK